MVTADLAATQPVGLRPSADPQLAHRAREARAVLVPTPVVVPAPRTEDGVMPSPSETEQSEPSAALVRDLDALVDDLTALERGESENEQVLLRLAGVVGTGVPGPGWSTREDLGITRLREVSEAARVLHRRAAGLLGRLDAEDRDASAVSMESLATTLLVVGVVADLEIFEVEH